MTRPTENRTRAARARRTAWQLPRKLQLAVLVGQGKTAEEIGKHPSIGASAAAVYAQASRHGLALSEYPHGKVCLELSRQAVDAFRAAAARRGISVEQVMERFVDIAGAEAAIIQNVLDD